MKTKIINLLLLCTLIAGGVLSVQERAEAQLVLVTSQYRIVNVDRGGQRIGVALKDANPNKRQTWVYIKTDTEGSIRKYYGNGLFRDHRLGFNGILDAAAARKGQLFKVHGGRDFSSDISAKKIWF